MTTTTREGTPKKHVYVVVVGDLGRSPRMLNHALSLSYGKDPADDNSQSDRLVTLLGYDGQSGLPSEVTNQSNIRVQHLSETPSRPTWMPLLVYFVLKTLFQTLALIMALPWFSAAPDSLFLQNTPAVPALMVMVFFCKLRGTRLVLDWHNYGFTILAVSSFGGNLRHPVVRAYKWLEVNFGKFVDLALCVSSTMQRDLQSKFGLSAVVVYDRPPGRFQVIDDESKPKVLGRIEDKYLQDKTKEFDLTELRGAYAMRDGKPMLIISSTSWTEDEDMSQLLEALHIYDAHSSDELPKILCVITGKGPTKATHLAAIDLRQWKNVKVMTPWLSADDYPLLLGCADLGVCMHTSSSGVDLPMKIVDMFGTGLPVAAIKFNAIHELVHDDQDGFVFEDATQLADIFMSWAQDEGLRERIKANVVDAQKLRWHEHWLSKVATVLEEWDC